MAKYRVVAVNDRVLEGKCERCFNNFDAPPVTVEIIGENRTMVICTICAWVLKRTNELDDAIGINAYMQKQGGKTGQRSENGANEQKEASQ